MRYFCTYFDRNYLLRGLTLYRSLKAHVGPFFLWVLCFDEDTYETLTHLDLPELCPIRLAEFEAEDEALLAAKKNRSAVEYFFTCSPSWPLYLLNRYPQIDLLFYLDADLYFFSDLAPIYEEMGDCSVLIVSHRLPERLKFLEELHGIYNVGLLGFRNDSPARACLNWWRERCLEWCSLVPENGRFADQKYLDDWPTRFPKTVALQHPGAGLAPWNWMNYRINLRAKQILVEGRPLIFYHYHGIKFFQRWLYDAVSLGADYGEMPWALRRALYQPYIHALKQTERWLKPFIPQTTIELTSIPSYGWRKFLGKLRHGRLMISPR